MATLAGMASLDIAATPAPDTSAPATGRSIELFESAMCCETGVCGPSVDQQLITVREDLRWAQEQGATVSLRGLWLRSHRLLNEPAYAGCASRAGVG